MITTFTCLLLATAALAEHGHYTYQGGNPPMDHNDDIYNRDLLGNLVFNFEQHRRDQPPQVEVREEDLMRYMYRPRTTSTPPAPTTRMIDFPQHIPEVKILPEPIRPHINNASTNKPFIGQTWNQIINKHLPPTVPPPPPTPQWMDLSDTLKNRETHRPHYNPVQVPQAPLYHQESVPPMQAESLVQSPYPQYSGVPNAQYVSTTEVPYSLLMQNVPAEPHVNMRIPSYPSRGHHKFSWNDVASTEARPLMVTTSTSAPQPLPSRSMNLPSSIPTLTPWSGDNFGK